MRYRLLSLALILLIFFGCSRDPHAKAARYIRLGNACYTHGVYDKALTLYWNAIRAEPQNGEAYYRAGLVELKMGHWGEAGDDLDRSASLQPDRFEPYKELANLYIFLYGLTVPPVRQAILNQLQSVSIQLHQRFPNSYYDFKARAFLQLFTDKRQAALVSFEEASRVNPRNHELLLATVNTLLSLGQVQRAETLLKNAGPEEGDWARTYSSLLSYYRQANQQAEVERLLRQEIGANPNLAGPYLELAAYYFRDKRSPEMTALLSQIAGNPARFPFGLLLAGDFYLHIHDVTHASDLYQRGVNRGGPDKPLYQKRMVEVFAKQKRLPEARKLIQDVLKANASDPEAVAIDASLKQMTEGNGQIQSAIAEFGPLLGKLPGDYVFKYLYGRAMLLTGNTEGAAIQFQDAVKLRSDYVWPRIALANLAIDSRDYGSMILLVKGLAANEGLDVPFDTAGQHPQGTPDYESILNIRPQAPVALSKLAGRVAETGRGFEEALVLAQRASQQMPGDDDIAATLALVYIRNSRPDKAIEILRPLLDRHPDNVTNRYRLAMALVDKGDKSQARQQAELALRGNAGSDELRMIRRFLAKLG